MTFQELDAIWTSLRNYLAIMELVGAEESKIYFVKNQILNVVKEMSNIMKESDEEMPF